MIDLDHRVESCDSCKGALAHRSDHYALGRWRAHMHATGHKLPEVALRVEDLIERYRAALASSR